MDAGGIEPPGYAGRAVSLPDSPLAARQARQAVRALLSDCGVAANSDHADTVVLLTSELVTNAIEHAEREPGAGRPVRLQATVLDQAQTVRVEVWDQDPRVPMMRQGGDLLTERGRGLWLVLDQADKCGVDPAPDGKTVWFELAIA